MKSKILFGTLLGGALLASCTVDDALETNKVAEKVNPAAPVFTVSFGDDALTRAEMDNNGIIWDKNDVMSLYHGGTSRVGANFFTSGVEAYQRNAIYAFENGGEEGAKFSTQAMVLPGTAVMIFPADTTFTNGGVNPVIRLTNEQDETTRNLTPYISEVLEIKNYTDNDADYTNSAGYGREYKIEMRRIGAQLRLALQPVNGKVDGIEFKKVAISVENANPFTTALEVKIGQERRNEGKTDEGSELVGTNPKGYESWKYSPWIEPASGATVETISTTDIATLDATGVKAAYFTLLPPDDRDGVVLSETETVKINGVNAFKKPKFSNATITVYTNYGKVELTDGTDAKDENGLWKKGDNKMTMTNGLAEFLTVAFPAADKTKPKYEGQLVAAKGTRYLTVDVSNLDMNGLHVENETDLNGVLEVYKNSVEGGDKDDVTFILDGAKTGDYKGKFVMSDTTWAKLAERFANEKNHLKLALCANEAPCAAVVLIGKDGSVSEVPALQFATTAGEQEKVQETVNVELVGNWKYTDVEGNYITDNKVERKGLKIDELTVTKGATIELKNYINAANKFKLVVANGATATVSGVVTLQQNLVNFGEIKIDNLTDQLSVDEDVELWNREPQGKDATGWAKDSINGGRISVTGALAIVSGSSGKIHNRGTINMNHNNAIVLISDNCDKDADIAAVFKNEQQLGEDETEDDMNRFGSIYLRTSKAGEKNLNIKISAQKGFIKYFQKTGQNCNDANYCIVDNDAFPTKNATYVEIEYKEKTVDVKSTLANVAALVVPTGTSLYIESTTNDTALLTFATKATVYVEGTIIHACPFAWEGKRNGYFGDSNGKGGIFSSGNSN